MRNCGESLFPWRTEHQSGISAPGGLSLILDKPFLLGSFTFEPLLGALVELALEGLLRLRVIGLALDRDTEPSVL